MIAHLATSEKAGRFVLRVSSSEVSGPPGAGSQAERGAQIPRPPSGIHITSPFTPPLNDRSQS